MHTTIIQKMIEAGIHFGHTKKNWNPKMKEYIFGINHGIHIINLDKTFYLFQIATNIIYNISKNNGNFLFVGTKKQAKNKIKKEAEKCNMPYVNNRWLGGTLTNNLTILKSLSKLSNLEKLKTEGIFLKITKKEAIKYEKKIKKLEKNLVGIKTMVTLPDAIIIVDSKIEKIAIKEAKKLNIFIIALVDTDSNFEDINYFIPTNDDSEKAISFFLENFSKTIVKAKI